MCIVNNIIQGLIRYISISINKIIRKKVWNPENKNLYNNIKLS